MQHSHTPTYTMTQFSSFHKTYALYTHATHSHSNFHTDTCIFLCPQNVHTLYACTVFLFPQNIHYTIHIYMQVATHLHSNLHTNTYSFPLSTKHIHYTRMQHIHPPAYTLTHTVFLFPQNVHTLYARTVFLFPQNIQDTIHTGNTSHHRLAYSFPLAMPVQFSSFHKTYIRLYTHATHSHSNLHTNTYTFPLATQYVTLYTYATHSHSNLHTNTYSFPLATQCVTPYTHATQSHSNLHTNTYSFPLSTTHTLHYTHV